MNKLKLTEKTKKAKIMIDGRNSEISIRATPLIPLNREVL